MEKNKKIIITVITVIIAIIIIFAVLKIFSGKNDIKTNSDAYSRRDVAYTCTKPINENGNKGTITADVVYNDNGYETTVYYKMVVDYAEMNDEKMLSILETVDPYGGSKMSSNYEKFNVNGTTNLGLSDFGQDTIITRSGNTVTYTYKNTNYNEYKKLTSSDKETLKETFKSEGYTIK